MANRILQIGNETKTAENEQVYVDIDMDSRQNAEGNYKVGKSVNIRAIQNSLDNIFRWIPGERILNPEFGSRIREYLYEGITPQNKDIVAQEIRRSVVQFDDRVNITNITGINNINNDEDNTMEFEIEYTINGLEDRVFHKQFVFDRN